VVNITCLANGKCSAELKVDDEHTNPMGGLHGGFSATLVDCISTYALMSYGKGSSPATSVSVDMHMSYLKGAKKGDDILVDAEVVKTGKSLAFLEVEIKNKATGDVLVKGSHTKFIMQAKKE